MMNTEAMRPRPELTDAQRRLLETRLQRARQTMTAPKDRTPAIPRRGTRDSLPLSSAQQRLWFIDQLEPGTAVYNVSQAVRMSGALDVRALEGSLNEIIRRHESLRTNFVSVDGSPIQVIADHRTLSLAVHDLAANADARREIQLRRMLSEEARRPFDLSIDPLLRAQLFRLGPKEHVFVFTMHHIISDGWSLGVFFEELAFFYEAAVAGERAVPPELPVQYGDFVLWERDRLQGPDLNGQLAYWKKQLLGCVPVVDLPADHPRPVESSSRGATRTLALPLALTRRLKAYSQREGATLFMTLLAAFQTLLHRYGGQEDIAVGSVVAGRSQVSLEKLIGFFVNTLVLRGNLSGDPTFNELLGRIRETTLGALAHQDLPFSTLVEELRPDRTLSRNPLFQVMFVLQNTPAKPARLPGLELQPLEVESGTAKFDLLLSMTETAEGLQAALEYNADLFEGETMERMLAHFQVLLAGIADDPGRKISALPLLTPEERHQVLVEWNLTQTDYPRDATIDRLFTEQTEQTPDATALVWGERSLTYRELEARTRKLAGQLRRHGVGPDVLVGVYLERSLELVIALLAIIRAGGAYVSLDPAYPVDRLGFMLMETKAPVLLTVQKLDPAVTTLLETARAGGLTQPPTVIRLDSPPPSEPAGDDGAWEPPTLTPDNLAYVSYTSGSTGKPKGVCVVHRGVVRLVKNTNFARFEAGDVFLQFAPVAFDASTLEIWGPLLNGGRLVVFPPVSPSLSGLGEFIQNNGITVLWLTAGLFHQMAEEHLGHLKNVRLLLAGGDVLSVPQVIRALKKLSGTQFVNGYGPTENTTFTCCHAITGLPSPRRSVPIGRPVANTVVYILDAQRQPVPIGVPGELYTGGDGLARGYLEEPAMTAEKFILHAFAGQPEVRLYKTGDRARWLPDGSIEFLGRIDRQVKIRGFRVEPAEVEAALLEHPSVKDCVVDVADDHVGGKCLVAYLVTQATETSAPADWRDHLKNKLPDYMVPSTFVFLDALRLSPNGKIDYSALRSSVGEQPEPARSYTAPRDETERRLAELWEAVLGVTPIGVHDQFFDLGGHSLIAVRLLAKVEKTFARRLPVSAVFQHPTVARLSVLLQAPEPEALAPATSLVGVQTAGSRPPLYLVHGVGGGMFWGYANLARHLGPEQPVHAFKSRGLDGLPEWPTIEEMARHYVADLRAAQPRGPYVLGGFCFGGNVAYEMGRVLRAAGEEVQVILINSSPPNSEYERVRFRWSVTWMAKFCRNLGFWLRSFLLHWEPAERRDFLRWKGRLFFKTLAGWVRVRKVDAEDAEVESMVDLAAFEAGNRLVWQTHVRALIQHRPEPYDGRVVLIRDPGHRLLCSFDERCGWGELVRGGVTVKILPGDHSRILQEPFVAAVADELRRCVDALADPRATKGGGA